MSDHTKDCCEHNVACDVSNCAYNADGAGAWYTYGDVRVQGRDSMKEFLREHPDVSDQIEAEIRANAHKLMSPQARKAAIASGRAVEVAADDFQG